MAVSGCSTVVLILCRMVSEIAAGLAIGDGDSRAMKRGRRRGGWLEQDVRQLVQGQDARRGGQLAATARTQRESLWVSGSLAQFTT